MELMRSAFPAIYASNPAIMGPSAVMGACGGEGRALRVPRALDL